MPQPHILKYSLRSRMAWVKQSEGSNNKLVRVKSESPTSVINVEVAFNVKETAQPTRPKGVLIY